MPSQAIYHTKGHALILTICTRALMRLTCAAGLHHDLRKFDQKSHKRHLLDTLSMQMDCVADDLYTVLCPGHQAEPA